MMAGKITGPYGLTRKLAADATAIKVIRVKFHWAWQRRAKRHNSITWTLFDVVRALISTFGNIWVYPTISGQKGRWEKDLSVWMVVRVVPEISMLPEITGRLHHAGLFRRGGEARWCHPDSASSVDFWLHKTDLKTNNCQSRGHNEPGLPLKQTAVPIQLSSHCGCFPRWHFCCFSLLYCLLRR